MAAAEILAVGTGAANSADVVIAAGDSLTVALKDAAGPGLNAFCAVDILLKDDAGQYFVVDQLQSPGVSCLVIQAAGTYRFSRLGTSSAVGVFSG